jgi:hypothetical protein
MVGVIGEPPVRLLGRHTGALPVARHVERIHGPHIQPRHVDAGHAGGAGGGLAQLDRPLPVHRRLGVAEHPLGSPGRGHPGPQFLGGAARGRPVTGHLRGQRLARRRGKQRSLVAVGNSILVITWHLLSDPEARFTDLGPGWHDRLTPLRRRRQLIAELERLSGQKVILQEAA